MNSKKIVVLSPLLIIAVNLLLAIVFGKIIGKWAFIPMIAIGWLLWLYLIVKYGGINSIKKWIKRPQGAIGWSLLAMGIGLLPLPFFIFHFNTVTEWTVWLPWIILALVNPWIEEFYWRGLLLDYTQNWPNWVSIFFSSLMFALNHAAFGINSELHRGFEVILSTLIMGLIWSIVYKKTKSLRWVIFAHFLVNFLGLSASAFLDLWEKGVW